MYRAVFDFGSGTTKMAMCQKTGFGSWATMFGCERETFVGYDVKCSGSKNAISDEMKSILLKEVEFHVARLREFEQRQTSKIPTMGFATAVYRECNNGRQILDEVSSKFGFPIRIITQAEEAKTGFMTGVQLANAAFSSSSIISSKTDYSKELITWDSGGSSFQLSYGTRQQQQYGKDSWTLQSIYEGPWGNSKVGFYFMTEIQKKSGEQLLPGKATMNPCAPEQFELLINDIKADLRKKTDPSEFAWLNEAIHKKKTPIVTIGGETSAFKLCSTVLGRSFDITSSELRQIAQDKFIGRSDEDITETAKRENMVLHQRHIILGKLALLTAVMETFDFPSFSFFQSVGTTNGMAAVEEFWSPSDSSKL